MLYTARQVCVWCVYVYKVLISFVCVCECVFMFVQCSRPKKWAKRNYIKWITHAALSNIWPYTYWDITFYLDVCPHLQPSPSWQKFCAKISQYLTEFSMSSIFTRGPWTTSNKADHWSTAVFLMGDPNMIPTVAPNFVGCSHGVFCVKIVIEVALFALAT